MLTISLSSPKYSCLVNKLNNIDLRKILTSCVCEKLMTPQQPFFSPPKTVTLTFALTLTDDLEHGTNRKSCHKVYSCEI